MKWLLIGSLILVPVTSHADAQDVMDYYKVHKSDELFVDLYKNYTFAPPYETMQPILELVIVCDKKFFDEEPMYRSYAQISIRDDYLGTAAGSSSFLNGFTKRSGGSAALYDYISEDFVYLLNVRNRPQAKEAAKKLYKEFSESPQSKKVGKKMASLTDKDKFNNLSKEDQTKLKALMICGLNDMYYTIFGGKEDSISVDTLAGIKHQIHRVTMDNSMSQIEEFVNEAK